MIEEMTDITDAIEIGLPYTENHRVYVWSDGRRKVYFSATQHGEALSIHLAAQRKDRPALRRAANEFCEFLFTVYEWCKMVIGIIHYPSVVNLSERCGFFHVGNCESHDGRPAKIMVRPRL